MLRQHSWSWLLDHSTAKDVSELQSLGFGQAMVLPYFYLSIRHEQDDGSIRYVSTPAKKEGRIIAFNRGSNVRIIHYSEDMVKALGIA